MALDLDLVAIDLAHGEASMITCSGAGELTHMRAHGPPSTRLVAIRRVGDTTSEVVQLDLSIAPPSRTR